MSAATHYWLNTAGAVADVSLDGRAATQRVVPVAPPEAPEERCEKTDLYVSQCAHCRGHDNPKPAYRPQHVKLGGWKVAEEPGECCRCGKPFRVRHTVRWDFDDGGWIAHNCCRHRRPRRGRGKALLAPTESVSNMNQAGQPRQSGVSRI